MQRNPYNTDNQLRIKGVAAVIISAALLFVLIYSITDIDLTSSIAESTIFIVFFAFTAYYYWYISDFLAAFQAKALFTVIIISIIDAATYAIISLTDIIDQDTFKQSSPAIIIFGLLLWIILLQDYSQFKLKLSESNETNDEIQNKEIIDIEENEEFDKIERITVKEGTKLHIIEADNIFFIQAYGDYAMINTENGKYLKEKTMKYFETNLPDTFIRIHRSCIVNTRMIARAELFGKESYYIYLKNGACIRASSTGYKLLKEKLHY